MSWDGFLTFCVRYLFSRNLLAKCVTQAWAITSVEAYPKRVMEDITVFNTVNYLMTGAIDL